MQRLVENDGALRDEIGERLGAVLHRLVENAGALADSRGKHLGALLQRAVESLRALADGRGEHLGALLQRVVESLRALADGDRQRLGALLQRVVEQHGALADRRGQRLGALLQGVVHQHGALRQQAGEARGAVFQRGVERIGVLADRGGEGIGTVLQRLVEQDRALRDGRLQPLDAGGERRLQRLGALLHGLVEGGGALHHHALQRGEVLRRAFDHLRQTALLFAQTVEQARHGFGHPVLRLVHLLGGFARTGDEQLGQLNAALGELLVDRARRGGDIAGDLLADAFQSFADPRAVIGQRLALGGELADQAAHANLVLAIGALERGDLAVHHGFELARPADGAGDGVVHGGDLAANGLSHGGDRLLGEPVGLGQPDRDLGHGRGHEAQFLRAPHQQRQEPEDDDRNDNGDGGGERRRAAEQARHPVRGDLRRNQAEGEKAADDEPERRCGKRDQERRARGPLLEREDQPADRGNVVIGRRGEAALRGRAGGALGAHELTWRRGRGARARRLGEFHRGFRRDRLLGRLRRLLAFRLDDALRASAARP